MGMTIDDAIKKYKNNAEYERTHGNLQGCLEFQQLAGWLKDYKRLLEQEPATKNDLQVDCISREQAQTEIEINASRYTIAKERGGTGQVEWSDQLIKVSDAVDIIRHLPPVTPREPVLNKIREQMSGIMDMSDDELANHYFDMAHLPLTAETKDHDVAFYYAVVMEMAARFARNVQDPDEVAADGNI